jgi:hypothetical protein
MKKGIILTAAGPNMHGMLHDYSLPTFKAYAKKWGYGVEAHELQIDGDGNDDAAKKAKWAKLGLMEKALESSADIIVWIDADVLIMRHDEDIAGHLLPGTFQALTYEMVPTEHRISPNTGVWIVRNCDESREFIKLLYKLGPQPGPWNDQGTVLEALGWYRGNEQYHGARPGAGSAYLQHTSVLPLGWNQTYLGPMRTERTERYAGRPSVENPHAVHFLGMGVAARRRAMAAYVAIEK